MTKGEEEARVPQKCPRCRTSNVAEALYCQGCGMALSLEAAQKADNAMERVVASLLEIAQDPMRAARLRKLLERAG